MKVRCAKKVSDGEPVIVCLSTLQTVSKVCDMAGLPHMTQEIEKISTQFGFKPEFEKVLPIALDRGGKIFPVVLVGMGDNKYLNPYHAQRIGVIIFEQLSRYRISNANVIISTDSMSSESSALDYINSLARSLASSDFTMSKKFKAVAEDSTTAFEIDGFAVVTECDLDAGALEMLANNIKFVKELGATPSNFKNPEILSDKIKTALAPLGIEVTVLGEDEMSKLGMHGILCIGQGSVKESKCVVMRWNGGADNAKELVFVGKGVTFDTGGISIKPAKNMEDMKFDMCGAAAAAGIIKLAAERKAKVNIVSIIGLVENMPSGSAIKPSDVVTTMSGKSIEILNTDAEGRVVLSDLLWYAQTKCNPAHIVDLATLTGAMSIALGSVYAGLFSNDDFLSDKLLRAGNVSGEILWRMPMHADFDKLISSDIADVKNISSVSGSASSSTAAHFLMRFIKEGASWAHLDIAGVSYKTSGGLPAAHCGAVGYGVHLLDAFVRSFE